MATATQDERILAIQTALGKDYFLINKVEGTEGISQLYSFDVELLHDSQKQSKNQHGVDINGVLGQAATISLEQLDGGTRYFNGIFNFFKLTGRTADYSFYNATLVPQIWELTQVSQSRIFQQKSVPDILKEVFDGYRTRFEFNWSYKPRNYCVQYDETDFDFVSRLMEEEGICYYFEFSSNAEVVVITDNFQQPRDCPTKSDFPIYDELVGDSKDQSALRSWFVEYKIQPGKVTLWDYHFQMPKKQLEAQQVSRHEIPGKHQLEIYKYPGGYARKYDGVGKDGGDTSGDLQNIFDDNQQSARDQIEIWDSDFISYYGDSDCGTMSPGHRFNLKNHPERQFNAPYILTAVTHEINQQPNYLVDIEAGEAYKNSFTCIPHGSGKPEYRPHVKTPKPKIFGTQTAFVVGPAGEEIFTDKYGRVKVQFHWDRQGKANAESSCWVRVAQSLAGNKWGGIFIPRIGMEVLVHFIGGDPDEPIITGCLYNPDTMPPYTLPDEKTKSTLKTNSSKGGGGFNELRFEDKKGSEQVFIHGEKNLDIRIKNDAKELIQNNRHLIVKSSQFEAVGGDKHLKVKGEQNEKIELGYSKKVGMDIQEKAGMKIAHDAGTEIHLKAGMTTTIEAGTMLTLKVGGNSISLNSGGVFISGTMVMINSGGAAGSGSGCSPTAPKDAAEADNANPGETPKPLKPPPPTKPKKTGAKASALKKAAKKGTPFVSGGDKSAKDKASKAAKEAIAKIGKTAKSTVDKVQAKAEKAVDEVVEKAEKAVTNLGKKVDQAIDEAKAAEKAAEQKLKQAADKIQEELDAGIAKVKQVADKGKEIVKKEQQKAEEKLKQVEEKFEEAADKAADLAEKEAEKLKKKAEKAQEDAAKAKKAAQEKAAEIKNEVEEKAAETKKEVEQKIDEAKKAFDEKKAEISKGLDDLAEKLNFF